MSYREIARLIGMRFSAAQHRAATYQRHGRRFCVDFGRDNAIEQAREHWRSRRRKAKARPTGAPEERR